MSGTLRIEAVADPADCFALRRKVFIEEQGFSEADEWDALDAGAVHLLARLDGVALGTARLLDEGADGRIGRICVLAPARGTGLGAALVREGIAQLAARGHRRIVLGAQVQAMGFYEGLGFTTSGPEYDGGGVPHREMALVLPL
ncbi:GNAT family N-acetyltransferase [Pseudooceanicola sp. CBS1P-1]|uniref:GNAT family N-acetyltransferase n=1 Tax=Pseudooceanicola albus TaxID=2692189 RepID=A0A6L7G7U3_9RHOB|nr:MULTISPECIES: GNAT family N-acetyltransferase [Pseudooceanicola]MBT9384179.1 GNAT family N-acetyltransferase [Pseudooceanicola endophyticus]MXN19722.1 GNAT family N-acetyltransferase [Pseudooceanicola albus]